MVRKQRFEILGQLRYLTFSCYHRLALFTNDAIKEVFACQLEQCRASGMFELFGWVLMPEHVHLLLRPNLPEFAVGDCLQSIKLSVARIVLKRWKELDAPVLGRLKDPSGDLHFWQRGGGYDRNITSEEEYFEKLNYMHNNPVTRELVGSPCDWHWSSARWYAGERHGLVRIDGAE